MDDSIWVKMKGTVIGLAAATSLLAVAFCLAQLLQSSHAAESKHSSPANSSAAPAGALLAGEAERGSKLFDHNCAHCHGDDARGDEGPDLHGLSERDSRLAAIIKGGIKGEMPAFAKKFNDAEVQALIAYLRTLKE